MTLATLSIILCTAGPASATPLPERIAKTVTATWKCQDQVGHKRTKAGKLWKPHSVAYRKWQLGLWEKRLKACQKTLSGRQAVVRLLHRGLAGTPMSGSEADLEAAARQYGVSPFFIAAIAGTESSFGAASCRGNPYNAFGLASCGSSWRVPYFPTWRSAYLFMGRFLTDRWPSATTTHHFYGYAACSSCWGEKTAYHMQARFGVGSSVRYASG